jgi:hypothetical protein
MAQVFISYAHTHPVYADLIQNDLEDSGLTAWTDKTHIPGGEIWRNAIRQGINEAIIVVVIITKDATKSEWVNEEIRFANDLRKPCIPVIMQKLKLASVLRTMDLDARQAIDFATRGRKVASAELIDTLRKHCDLWQPTADQIVKLQHFSSHVRFKAIQYLGATGDYRVLPSLLNAILEEDNGELTLEVIRQLSNFRHPVVTRRFKTLIENRQVYENSHYRSQYAETAIEGLGKTTSEDETIREYLISLLDTQPDLWPTITHALGMSPTAEGQEFAFQRFLENLEGKPDNVRYLAMQFLERFKDKRAIVPLQQMAERESESWVIERIQMLVTKLQQLPE